MGIELRIPRVDSGGHEGQIKAHAGRVAQMAEEIHLPRDSRHRDRAQVIALLQIVLRPARAPGRASAVRIPPGRPLRSPAVLPGPWPRAPGADGPRPADLDV